MVHNLVLYTINYVICAPHVSRMFNLLNIHCSWKYPAKPRKDFNSPSVRVFKIHDAVESVSCEMDSLVVELLAYKLNFFDRPNLHLSGWSVKLNSLHR